MGCLEEFYKWIPSHIHTLTLACIQCFNWNNLVKFYNRILEKNWSCGAGNDSENTAIVNIVRYKEGYLIEGS